MPLAPALLPLFLPLVSPSSPFPIPMPSTVISFMERRAEGREENATNDITLSLNKHTTHDIIITADEDSGEPIKRRDPHYENPLRVIG